MGLTLATNHMFNVDGGLQDLRRLRLKGVASSTSSVRFELMMFKWNVWGLTTRLSCWWWWLGHVGQPSKPPSRGCHSPKTEVRCLIGLGKASNKGLIAASRDLALIRGFLAPIGTLASGVVGHPVAVARERHP
ncbi:hypothetical protein CRG98_046043 [Punica granatum]|uniref:Uncharacterized protein n=1 Tax=Punica granatum TaxID=22663 RepID=A0A2I0HPC9_PUNGR|nr:hypothetical protein CRG98_046043 [Punica granatum]